MIVIFAAVLTLAWPEPTATMKPWVYNWWMGSAVDAAGLEYKCRELADKGFGGFHVIPTYGAKGYEKQWKGLLSPEWVGAWNLAAELAARRGLGIDLTMGCGWCFGGPVNWLDLYALADIPETEMFGRDCRDVLVSKFASSAAHLTGKRLVSDETCTWVDEHFHERPAEIKSVVDRLFLAGVNHCFYHGCCYSPVDAVWPGWCFYASCEMNPRNPIWREIGTLSAYITRCQSVFQTWEPDNDLVLLFDPPYTGKQMSVHNATEWFHTPDGLGPVTFRTVR